jgi:hypothetical protein
MDPSPDPQGAARVAFALVEEVESQGFAYIRFPPFAGFAYFVVEERLA